MQVYMKKDVFESFVEALKREGVPVDDKIEFPAEKEYEMLELDCDEEEECFERFSVAYEIGYVTGQGSTELTEAFLTEEGYDCGVVVFQGDERAWMYSEYIHEVTPVEERQATDEIAKIRHFLKKCPYELFEQEMLERVVGHEQDIKNMSTNVYLYLTSIVSGKGKLVRNNFLLAGPSGSGKTHFIKSLQEVFKKYRFDFKVFIFDATTIMVEGFRGKNMSHIFDEVGAAVGNNNEYCIICFDEFDKRLLPFYDSSHTNVNKAIQSEFLTVIEGSNRTVKYRKTPFDTGNVLFICAGAFQAIRDNKESKNNVVPIGFGSEPSVELTDANFITQKDIVDIGSSPELIGRFTGGIYNFYKPDKDTVKTIIKRLADETVPDLPISIEISDEALDSFCEFSQSEYGVRMIKERLVATIQPLIREVLLSNSNSHYTFYINEVGDATINEDCDEL